MYEGVSETVLQTRVNKECYYGLSCLPVVQACHRHDRCFLIPHKIPAQRVMGEDECHLVPDGRALPTLL